MKRLTASQIEMLAIIEEVRSGLRILACDYPRNALASECGRLADRLTRALKADARVREFSYEISTRPVARRPN